MSVSLPNGAVIALATGLGAAVAFTAITNATTPVLTVSTGHGVIAGDFLVMTSGWSRLNNKVVRVLSVTTTSITLDGYDTTNTTTYPAGSGTGSLQDVSGWTQVQQILTSASAGGAQQFLQYQFLEADLQLQIPTFKNAASLTLSIADDPTLAGYILAAAANDDRLPRAVRVTLPNSSKLLYNCYVSLNKTPTLTVNQLMACEMTLSQLAEVVRYAS